MTIDRDELIGRAVREVVDTAPPAPAFDDLVAFRSLPPARPSRVLTFAVAAAAVVLAGVGLVMTRGRSDAPGAPSSTDAVSPTTTAPASPLDRLLYPDPSAGTKVTWSQIGPDLANRAAGALVSPSGNVFDLYVSENFWGSLPPTLPTRVVNGQTFGVNNEDGTRAYPTLNACTMATVGDHSTNPVEWSAEPMQLLEGFELQGNDVSVRLPPGWTSLGAGSSGLPYMLQFDAMVDGTRREVSVSQVLDAPAGVVADGRGQATPIVVSGAPGWYLDGDGGSIVWATGDVAVRVSVRDGSLADLQAAAALLQPGHGQAWAALVAPADPSADSTVVGTLPPPMAGCGPHHLTIVP